MQTGAAWLGGQLSRHARREITITQGTAVLASVTAWMDSQEQEVIDQEGFSTKLEWYVWTIAVADLVGLEIRKGAVFAETLNGVTSKYEVMPVDKSPAIKKRDTSGILMDYYTKKVA